MSYERTEYHRNLTAEKNRLIKRKFPQGYDCRSRLYRIWRSMYFRCYQPIHKAFANYGGRGITICPEWIKDYAAFMNWALSSGYAEDLTIDRIDNNQGYSPSNCRWVSMKAQQSNRRNSIHISAFGEKKTLKEWAADERCKVGYMSLRARVKSGRDIEWCIAGEPRSDIRFTAPFSEERKRKISEKAKNRYAKIRAAQNK